MKHETETVQFTNRDRVLRAWQNSMELVRDFQLYARELEDEPETAAVFREFAEDECVHASRFRDILRQYEQPERS